MFIRPVPTLAILTALGAVLISAPSAAGSVSRPDGAAPGQPSVGTAPAAQAVINVPCDENALVTAIATTNATPGPDTINLAPGCTYTLTTPHGGGEDGLPPITGTLTINGRHAAIARSTSAARFRVLNVSSSGNLTLDTVTISNGAAADAAGILNFGVLTARDSTIRDNTANSTGGGITSLGTLNVVGSVIRNNSAAFGGGIDTLTAGAVAVIKNTAIRNNTATETGGGIVNAFSARLTMTSSLVDANSAGDAGGGIDNEGSTLSCHTCLLTHNRAVNQGGGIRNVGAATAAFTRSSIVGNRAADGGGIYEAGGPVTLTQTFVTANRPNNCAPANSVPNCTR